MSCSNPNTEIEFLEEIKAISLKETPSGLDVPDYPNLRKNREFISAENTESVTNFGTIINANVESIDSLLKESINWDEIIESEPLDIVESRVIEELQSEELNPQTVIGALKTITTISESFEEPRLDILHLLLFTIIPKFPTNLQVQIWGLQAFKCLKRHLNFEDHKIILKNIFNETINAIKRFKVDSQLHEIALNIMNDLWQCFPSDRDDAYVCVELIMEALCMFRNKNIQKLVLQILSKWIPIQPKISTIQRIGWTKEYRSKLYSIIEEKIKANTSDDELKTVLDVWLDITRNAFINARIISDTKLYVFLELVSRFPDDKIIQKRALYIIEKLGIDDIR